MPEGTLEDLVGLPSAWEPPPGTGEEFVDYTDYGYGLPPYSPETGEDFEGLYEGANTEEAIIGDAVQNILDSGMSDAEMADAAAELLRESGHSAHILAQVSDIPLDVIEEALAAEGYDINGNMDPNFEGGTSHPFDTEFDPTIPDDDDPFDTVD